jgi:hypothetical protein
MNLVLDWFARCAVQLLLLGIMSSWSLRVYCRAPFRDHESMVPAGDCSAPFRDHEPMVPAIQGIIKRQNSGLGHPFGPQAPAHGAALHMRAIPSGVSTPRTLYSIFLTRRFLQALTNRGIQLRMKHPKSVGDCQDNHTLHLEGSINDSRHLERAAAGAGFDGGEVSQLSRNRMAAVREAIKDDASHWPQENERRDYYRGFIELNYFNPIDCSDGGTSIQRHPVDSLLRGLPSVLASGGASASD